jgi:DNA repair exonuclease SbcCD ATPase subunit
MLTRQQVEFGLAELRSRYEQGRGQLALLEAQHTEKQAALDQVHGNLETWRLVQALFTRVAEFARTQLKQRLEETVTAALQAVFATEDLRFEVELRELGGKPAAEWRVVSKYAGVEVGNNPEEARGGGIVDVISLALRLALLELSRPRPEGPVLLDEPGKHISAEYAANLAHFLRAYAQRTGRQLVLITHNEQLAGVADQGYRVALVQGRSEVVAV